MNMWTTKIERAKQHKEELQKEIKLFFDSQPYKIGTKSEPRSKRLIYYLVKADVVPEKIALITGDVIQNLRSSLDYLAYMLFTIGPGNGTQGHHIYFPIAADFDQYESDKNRKTEGIGQQAKDLIDKVKPYKGGNDSLWKIHELNNIDKHRLLVTVGSSFGSVDVGAHMQASMRKTFPDLDIPAIPLFLKPADILFPLKAGDELFIDGPDAKPIPNMQFKFNIVLNESGVVEGEPLIEALQSMIDAVDSLVPMFAPLTSKL